MPYTPSQVRALAGMGIVPWVTRSTVSGGAQPVESKPITERELASVKEQVAQLEHAANLQQTSASMQTPVAESIVRADKTPVVTDQAGFLQTPLVEIPFRGQSCTQLGKSDAPLLILVEATSTTQKQYPFEPKDAKIFEDMLRAIAWRRQDVCLAVLPPVHEPWLLANDGGPCVADLCKAHRDAVLLFRHQLTESLNVDDLTVPLIRDGMFAWQLPHPAKLRESPARKRQAWNVLKAARARLG